MIFFTRDSKNKDTKLFVSKFDLRDLTGHSGKFETNLQQEIAEIRHSQTIELMSRAIRNRSN